MPITEGALLVTAIAFGGAFVGALGFEVFVVRRRDRKALDLIERPAAGGGRQSIDTSRLPNRALGRAIDTLTARLQEAETMATTDRLTGLMNRQALFGALEAELHRAQRYDHPLTIAFLDIDHFKRVNDTHGHAVGDRLLHHVATVVRESIRSVDRVGRYGGEEFMLILPETDPEAAAELADTLRRRVGRSAVELGNGLQIAVTMSVGVAGGHGRQLRLDALVRAADAGRLRRQGARPGPGPRLPLGR